MTKQFIFETNYEQATYEAFADYVKRRFPSVYRGDAITTIQKGFETVIFQFINEFLRDQTNATVTAMMNDAKSKAKLEVK